MHRTCKIVFEGLYKGRITMEANTENKADKNRGCLYGIGVGPGDPEYLTLKAVRLVNECEYIAVPNAVRQESAAYQIAVQAIPELGRQSSDRHWLELPMPMTKDIQEWHSYHKKAAEKIAVILEKGKNVAFLTLGDPTVYSTYMYIDRLIAQLGYRTEIINGVPSFCAAAGRLGQALSVKEEQIHIIPANYDMELALSMPGTKVFMKVGRRLSELKRLLRSKQCTAEVREIFMVENCGMEGERCYVGLEQIPEEAGYFSIVMIK